MGSASSLTGRGGTAQSEERTGMFKCRIYLCTPTRGFSTEPQYAVGKDTADVRRRLVRQHGPTIAALSSVTIIAPHPIDREVVA
jgi:hypothetical protein